jgi:hypothetical protein
LQHQNVSDILLGLMSIPSTSRAKDAAIPNQAPAGSDNPQTEAPLTPKPGKSSFTPEPTPTAPTLPSPQGLPGQWKYVGDTGKTDKTTSPQEINLTLEGLDPNALGLKEEHRTIDSPAYTPKNFVGYRFATVLKALITAQGIDVAHLDLTKYSLSFVCSDGYKMPAAGADGLTPLSTILNGDDFLATGVEHAGNWPAIEEGHLIGKVPDYYYVMGDSILKETWPLMVKQIEIKKMP